MFWISLGALIFGTILCFLNGRRKLSLCIAGLWVAAFFGTPFLFSSGWPFLILQSLMAIVVIFTWKYLD